MRSSSNLDEIDTLGNKIDGKLESTKNRRKKMKKAWKNSQN